MTNSEKLYNEALKLMPGGVNSPVRACRSVGSVPLFIERAVGDRIFDADGKEYIDYICSWGPNILGHGHPRVIEAVKAACEKSLTFGACHRGEIELARLIRKHVPSMELLRLVNSGTEAVMSAIRAARGYTGRDKIIKFEGCYHGHSDGLLVKAGSGLLTNSIPDSAGVPKAYTENTLLAVYNDESSVEKLFWENKNSIACVIVEPCAANMGVVPPKQGFLNFLRDITDRYNTVLIFDEVITGFRLSIGGAQEYYGVTPDLTALGKIVGGGMPLAAYGGRREIMECVAPLGSVYQAGTLSGNPVAVSAGIETLKILEENKNIYSQLDKKAEKIENSMREVGLNVNRVGSLLTAFFTEAKVTDYNTAKTYKTYRYAEFYNYLLKNGIYIAPSQFEAMFVSAAHTEEDIEIHPGFSQSDTVNFCREQGITVQAWSPLGSGRALKKKEIISCAQRYDKTPAQICLKWCVQNGIVPIVKSTDYGRMKSNLDINDFEIDKKDMDYLNNLPYLGSSGLDSETLTLFG